MHAHELGVYTLAKILSKVFGKTMENWGPYLGSSFDKLTIWSQLKISDPV